jgi:hypothetical protein
MNDAGSRITAPSPGPREAISGPLARGCSGRAAPSTGDEPAGRTAVLEAA